jgi:hypothetical protein
MRAEGGFSGTQGVPAASASFFRGKEPSKKKVKGVVYYSIIF